MRTFSLYLFCIILTNSSWNASRSHGILYILVISFLFNFLPAHFLRILFFNASSFEHLRVYLCLSNAFQLTLILPKGNGLRITKIASFICVDVYEDNLFTNLHIKSYPYILSLMRSNGQELTLHQVFNFIYINRFEETSTVDKPTVSELIINMYYYSLPLMYINLCGEMIYVLHQRLSVQMIPKERKRKVLDDIITSMLNRLDALFSPQKSYNIAQLYNLFTEIAHSSVMKLSAISMSKLFDLMVIVFKQQLLSISSPKDLIAVTINHLEGIRSVTRSAATHKRINDARKRIEKTYSPMNDCQLFGLRYNLMNFLQNINIRVSLFLKSGYQNEDGSFVIPLDATIAQGCDLPGIMKNFNANGSVSSVSNFPSGGDYKCAIVGQATELGTSIYENMTEVDRLEKSDGSSVIDTESKLEETVPLFRRELNLFLSELTGNENFQCNGSDFAASDLLRDRSDLTCKEKASASDKDSSFCNNITKSVDITNSANSDLIDKITADLECECSSTDVLKAFDFLNMDDAESK